MFYTVAISALYTGFTLFNYLFSDQRDNFFFFFATCVNKVKENVHEIFIPAIKKIIF